MKKPSVAKPESPLSTGQRWYFYVTAATAGAAVMIIEILGAKMLAPYVGTSHFVWTAQIAVTLAALATGYYCGGRWVDRSPQPTWLYLGLLVAGLYLCAAVTQVERVAYACLEMKLALGSLVASAFLFFVPLALLGAVGPFLVRTLTSSLQSVGGSVGRLIAVSTLGSFAGTVLIGYVLIPLLPNSLTMVVTAGAVMLVAAVWLVIWGRKPGPNVVALLALGLGAVCGWATQCKGLLLGPKLQEIYRGNSNFGLMQVIQSRQGQRRYLLSDFLMQGAYDAQTKQSYSMFSYLLHGLARAYATNVNDVLVIGLGVGIVPMQFAEEGVKVDAVEINPAVVPLAREYFDFEPERINVTLGDGRQFVNATGNRYDAVLVDAFLGDSSPSHLMTQEAFAAMRRLLRPGGVLVIDCWGNLEPGRDFLLASLQKTLAAVFPNVRIHCDTRHLPTDNLMNIFFVASTAPLNLKRPTTFGHVHPICRDEVEAAFTDLASVNPDHGIVLTDDYNPVDYHDAANREGERRYMAMRMQP